MPEEDAKEINETIRNLHRKDLIKNNPDFEQLPKEEQEKLISEKVYKAKILSVCCG
jgi:hypothetical protein